MLATVSFDVDDVLADFHKKFRALAHELHPLYGELPPSNGWDQPNWPLTHREKTLLHMTWQNMPFFHADLEVCPGVDVKYLQDLSKRVRLLFTTARREFPTPLTWNIHLQTRDWIAQRFGIEYALVAQTQHKTQLLEVANAVVHVDDRVATIRDIERNNQSYAYRQHASFPTRPILMAHCQNVGEPDRVEDWASLERIIESTLDDWVHNG